MAVLSNVEIGSIIYNLIPNITTGISGLLPELVNQSVYFAEQFTGDSIPTSAIAEKYQPAIISLTSSSVLEQLEIQGLGTKSVSIGELSITKGMNTGVSKSLRDDGLNKLMYLGQKTNFYQTWS